MDWPLTVFADMLCALLRLPRESSRKQACHSGRLRSGPLHSTKPVKGQWGVVRLAPVVAIRIPHTKFSPIDVS